MIQSAIWNTAKMTHGEQCLAELWGWLQEIGRGPLPQVHFVSWTVLGCDFVPPVLNICIQFIRRVYSCWSGNGARLCVFNHSVLLISVAYFLEPVFLATCHLSSCNLLQKELVLQNNFSRKLQLSAPFISVPALKDTSARRTKTGTDTQPEPGSCPET